MAVCPICKKHERKYFFQGKLTCQRCDQFTFDVEIECDEIQPVQSFRKEEQNEAREAAVN